VGEDLHPVALLPDRVLRDVVPMVVCEQQQLHIEPVALSGVEQRARGSARVDHDRLPVLLVADEIRVGKPVLLHGALDDHGRAQANVPRAAPASGASERPFNSFCGSLAINPEVFHLNAGIRDNRNSPQVIPPK
jgi:hypothetical protein